MCVREVGRYTIDRVSCMPFECEERSKETGKTRETLGDNVRG